MSFKQSVRVSSDRIGALVGKEGKTRQWLEDACKVEVLIDSRTGDTTVTSSDINDSNPFKAIEIVNAIARGFSQERASRLLNDDVVLSIIDIKSYIGKSHNTLLRIKGRIIGEDGKARRLIEELSKANISVYGHTIAVIGKFDQIRLAEDAIHILVSGGPHKAAYDLLQRHKTAEKVERLKLWEDGDIGQ